MSEISSSEARKNLSNILSRTEYGKERFFVKRRGGDGVAIIPMEDYKLIEQIERIEDEIDVRDGKKALKNAKKNGTVPWQKVKAELKLK